MKNENISDDKFRSLIKDSFHQAPPSPWFTKKVLNRLPEKRRSAAAWIEYAIYLVATIVAAAYTFHAYNTMISSSVITVGDMTICLMYGAIAISSFTMFCYPWLVRKAQNSLRDK